MVVVPLSQSTQGTGMPSDEGYRSGHAESGYAAGGAFEPAPFKPVPANRSAGDDGFNWVRAVAAGTLALSGVLLMSGRRRAALVSAVTGTSLALLDQQESLRAWWESLPAYLDDVELVLNRAQSAVEDIAVQRDNLRRIFSR